MVHLSVQLMHLAIYIKTHKKMIALKVPFEVGIKVHLRLHLSCAYIALVGAFINAQKCTK